MTPIQGFIQNMTDRDKAMLDKKKTFLTNDVLQHKIGMFDPFLPHKQATNEAAETHPIYSLNGSQDRESKAF